MSWADLRDNVDELAGEWRDARRERQARRHLEQHDFDRLRDAGFLQVAVPETAGGLWRSVPESTRSICEVLRGLAAADPSVALVSSMHPAVIGFWLAPDGGDDRWWAEQRDAVVETARGGSQWGTITSEPGSGGDIARTKSVAKVAATNGAAIPGANYLISGDKHFGSGSGVTDFMITTAIPEDADGPSIFVFDVRDRPWDGSAGVTLMAEWDGVGMQATQSHAMRFEDCPGVRMAWPGKIEDVTLAAGPLVGSIFTSVVLGVFDEAVRTAKAQLGPKAADLRPYERVAWTKAEAAHWLAVQAFEGALRAVESADHMTALHATLRAKQTIAELAEDALAAITRVIGGGTYSRRSPFSSWYEDVRALGFLRPPWGLAYDNLYGLSFLEEAPT